MTCVAAVIQTRPPDPLPNQARTQGDALMPARHFS